MPAEDQPPSSLHRALSIVRALAACAQTGLGVSQRSQQLGLSPATTHRLPQQLAAEGLVTPGQPGQPGQRCRLGIDCVALDAVDLRTELAKAQGHANTHSDVIEGMSGAAVPVFDCHARVVAALSVGALRRPSESLGAAP